MTGKDWNLPVLELPLISQVCFMKSFKTLIHAIGFMKCLFKTAIEG